MEYIVVVINSFFRNRKVQVTYNYVSSENKLTASGVTQGLVHAPTLFNIYTNDAPKFKHV